MPQCLLLVRQLCVVSSELMFMQVIFSASRWFNLTKMNDFYIFSFRILSERSVSPYIIVGVTSQAVTYFHLNHLSNCCGIMYAISMISKERLHWVFVLRHATRLFKQTAKKLTGLLEMVTRVSIKNIHFPLNCYLILKFKNLSLSVYLFIVYIPV